MIEFELVLIALGVAAVVGGAIYFETRAKRAALLRLQNDQRINTIEQVNQQIKAMEATNVKDTISYKNAKEAYDAKYRNRVTNDPSK